MTDWEKENERSTTRIVNDVCDRKISRASAVAILEDRKRQEIKKAVSEIDSCGNKLVDSWIESDIAEILKSRGIE